MHKLSLAALSISLTLGLGGCTTSGSINAAWSFDAGSTSNAETAPLLYVLFQDHEVFQRNRPIHVWGTAKPADTVTISLAGESASATTDAAGRWDAVLAPLNAGGPYELTATSSSGQSQTNKDVLIGDVYLCSGQSNMEFPVRLASNYDSDVNNAHNTNIRLLHVQRFPSPTPRATFGAGVEWAVTSPDAVKEFSAACYFFGRALQPAVNVPVGLIEDAWGGSVIQAWISMNKMRELGGYEQYLDLLPIYAKSPKDAQKRWNKIAHAWWLAHDPASAATPAWNSPVYDDSSWDQIVPPGTWRIWNVPLLSTFNGVVWLRETVELTADQAKGAASLSLGAIDVADTTWVNGVEVGDSQGYDVQRNYDLPAGTLHAGKNLIAVGVLGGAGMLAPADQMTLKLADGSTVPLTSPWRYKTSAPMTQTGEMPDVPWLNQFGLSDLYNGMILPLGNTQVRGIVWYQGESDAGHPKEYARLLPALIADWRRQFGADTPFVVVQLPNFGPYQTKPEQSNWAEMREVERRVVNSTPNTGLAVTIDLGQTDNIHPTNKQEVGRRLALVVQHLIYGMDVVASGPTPVAAIRKRNTVIVSFAHLDKGLLTYENNRPIGFQICNTAMLCRFVDAEQNGNDIDLDVAHIRDAATVRFCWADSPICNVYNDAGLPAVPFELPITVATRRRK
ncbi:MAG: 9-O-acetylesterase [Alphaproteobacteria bacterium]|nr:9-O-acetylesterase [Alphaproteobacteria bacterium]MDE2111841.1 9-O-acetylesterase [Alphaproteobacteria bacterium]MDE2493581.1 9-O-acetylesterase [Alphaproteobacteria bacterium]